MKTKKGCVKVLWRPEDELDEILKVVINVPIENYDARKIKAPKGYEIC